MSAIRKEVPLAEWTEVGLEPVFGCRIFTLSRRRMRREQPAREADFYVLDSPPWVNVIALTDADELVLVEQFRQGVDRVTLEIPGGMVDAGESPREAAERELREETGFAAESWVRIGVIDPNPAILSNRCHTFLALGARQVEEPAFDANEQCRLLLRPYADAPRLVADGTITHALVVVALHFEALRRLGVPFTA